MIGFEINGTMLQLAANSVASIKRSNPFLYTDAINGEYSLPCTIIYTQENYQQLQGYFSFYKPKQKLRIPNVNLYDGTAFAYRGTLVVEGIESNINNPKSGKISGYFLTGISDFFSNVKDKLLKDMDWGGSRDFVWTTNQPFDGSTGFWQHVHETWTNADLPYVFYPIRNEGWDGGRGTYENMNLLDDTVMQCRLSVAGNYYSLCPAIYLHWLLRRIVESQGYTLSGDVLDDADFLKLTVPSFMAIEWYSIFGIFTNISFDLKDHVPPKMLVTELIIQLYQFFGIMFIFDTASRTVRLRALKNIKDGTRKDWTAYADANYKTDFNTDTKLFAFKNSSDSADSLPGSAFDPLGATVLTAVNSRASLPAANSGNVDGFIFVYNENLWMQCQYSGGGYDWYVVNYNMFGYEPPKSTDSFDTNISTMPVLFTAVNDQSINTVFRLYPACNQEGNWKHKAGEFKPWGMRLLFYRGLTADIISFGTPNTYGGKFYPFATNAINGLDIANDPQGNWALSYKHTLGSTETGVIAHWWAAWLLLLANDELATLRIWLPLYEMQQHQWDDVILIRSVPYVVSSMDVVLPYPGYVDGELKRIG